MDKKKMSQQAKILRDKKIARMNAVAKSIRPKVKDGVVKYDTTIAQKAKQIRTFATPPAPRTVHQVGPRSQQPSEQQQIQTQQKINPRQVTRKKKGCSGCKRKIGP